VKSLRSKRVKPRDSCGIHSATGRTLRLTANLLVSVVKCRSAGSWCIFCSVLSQPGCVPPDAGFRRRIDLSFRAVDLVDFGYASRRSSDQPGLCLRVVAGRSVAGSIGLSLLACRPRRLSVLSAGCCRSARSVGDICSGRSPDPS
jgi:hypothetical protein